MNPIKLDPRKALVGQTINANGTVCTIVRVLSGDTVQCISTSGQYYVVTGVTF